MFILLNSSAVSIDTSRKEPFTVLFVIFKWVAAAFLVLGISNYNCLLMM